MAAGDKLLLDSSSGDFLLLDSDDPDVLLLEEEVPGGNTAVPKMMQAGLYASSPGTVT